MSKPTASPVTTRTVYSIVESQTAALMQWIVVACSLFALHVYQFVLMGQDWKDDLHGWSFMTSSADGAGWTLLSVVVLGVTVLVMALALMEQRSTLLWVVSALAVLRFVLVVYSSIQANGDGYVTRFGVGLTVFTLVITAVVAAAAASLDR